MLGHLLQIHIKNLVYLLLCRDPRGWAVSAAYAAIVPSTELGVKAAVRHVCVLALHASRQLVPRCGGALILCLLQDDASNAEWWTVTKLPPLAFDHKLIVRSAFQRLGERDDVNSEGGLDAAAALSQTPCSCMSECNCGVLQMPSPKPCKRALLIWRGLGHRPKNDGFHHIYFSVTG